MRGQISAIFGGKKVELRQTPKAVTPFGGLAVFVEFLGKIGFAEQVKRAMPFELKSPNAIAPVETFTAFVVAVVVGARRFAQAGLVKADQALQGVLGLKRFPTDDTIRNLFKRFTQGAVYRFYSGLWEWQLGWLEPRAEGWSLDLDSVVFERYGQQEGARKGHNPKKHGRPSHHPLLAVLAEAHFVLHGWLRSGNCSCGRGVVEFLKEALAWLGAGHRIRVVRADSGFFDDELLSFLEERGLSYIVVARLTPWLKRQVAQVRDWTELDENYAVGEFRLQLHGWEQQRRFVVIRERVREEKASAGRKLLDLPGYTLRIFVTNGSQVPQEVWRDYNQRADVENRIAELKYDLGADDFCLHEFFATEAAFSAILMLFNLLGEFQRASGMKGYRRPATLRTQVFLCGAVLGRAGRRVVLHLSESWGGLRQRKPLLDNLLAYPLATSPKLETAPAISP